jgi:long-chain acyl-CoA synthetase
MTAIRFTHFAERDPSAVAIVDPHERIRSRGELAALANRLARSLRRSGLVPGSVLAIAAPNCFEYVAMYLAAMQTGLYAVPINWHLAPGEIRYILENCRAAALLTHERLRTQMLEVVSGLEVPPPIRVAVGEIQGFLRLEDFVADQSSAPPEEVVVGRVLSYTSATTGRPKGVCLPLSEAERALDMSIARRIQLGTLPEEHVQLVASMLYHGAPLETVYVTLQMGHSVVLVEPASAEAVLRLIEKYRVTTAYMVPTMFGSLLRLDQAARSRYSLATLRRVVHGGAPCPIEIKRRMIEWLGPILAEAYGATEGAGTVVGSIDWLKYPGTVGRPIAGSHVKILGDDGEELPAGAVGTIYMTRYCGDRFEYLGDPEKTRACHRGEFFTVGDVGYLNEEGFLFICDRKVDMIIRSGMKVYSAEVEAVLVLHPGVADCAVFGVPDELTGEAVMAVVQPAPGVAAAGQLRSNILAFLASHLSLAKLPKYIAFVEHLPREATGKLQKKRLREELWARVRPGVRPSVGDPSPQPTAVGPTAA